MNDLRFQGENAIWNQSSFKLGGIASTSIGAGLYFIVLGSAEYFIVNDVANSKIQSAPSAGGGTMTFTDLTNGLTIDNSGVFEILNGNFFYCGGTNGIFYSNGGNIAPVGGGSPSSADMLKVANNFLFASYSQDPSCTVYWSNVADGTTWAGANSLTFRQNDGDTIRALSSLGQNLVIFKGNSVGLLSTQTTVVSGSVILGPLSTVLERIGCAGVNSVDHLPDGRLIFMGSDAHVYIFDGSIPTDISDQPFSGSNIQSSLNNLLNSGTLPKVYVRTYTPRHEVWINGNFVYNYLYNAWYTKTSGSQTTFFQGYSTVRRFRQIYGNISTVYNAQNVLISGATDGGGNGNLYLEDTFLGTFSPNVGTSNSELEFSIPVPADDKPNFQRFFILPLQTASASQTITYYTGRDGTYGSGTTYTTSGGWDRLKIAIPSSSVTTSFQVKVTFATTSVGITFDPAYVSDESVQ